MRRTLIVLGLVLLVLGFGVTRYVEQERRSLPQNYQPRAWTDGTDVFGEKGIPQREIFIAGIAIATAGAACLGLAWIRRPAPNAAAVGHDAGPGDRSEPELHRLGGRQPHG